MKIALFSSAELNISEENKKLAKKLAKYLKKYEVTLVTGGSLGIPSFIVEEYRALGGKTMMYSPDICPASHNKRFDNHNIRYYDEVVFAGGFTNRSLQIIEAVDGAIALNGRTGTLCESLIAIEEALPLIVLDGAGGVSEHFSQIVKFTDKKPFGFLEIGSSYGNQIDKLISHIKNHSS